MQMQRIKAIQEEAIVFMQEQQQKELETLKADLQRKADLKGGQEELACLRAEAQKLEAEQSEQRAKLHKEKELLEAAMQAQEEVEKEMVRIHREKGRHQEAGSLLRQTLAKETREMQTLSAESTKRKAEIDALTAAKEALQTEMEGACEMQDATKQKLEEELQELHKRKQEFAEQKQEVAEQIERAQARTKQAEEEELRVREERARMLEEERIRAALEYEAKKAQKEMDNERKRRQSEIDRLKKQIEQTRIREEAVIQEEEESPN